MSGTSAGWSPERRAAHSAYMAERNRDPAFAARAAKGRTKWPPERIALKRAQMIAQNRDPVFQARKLAGIARRRPRGFTVPTSLHPCVRGFYVEANEQLATRSDIAGRTGVNVATLTAWKHSMPLIDTLDAALNALGFELAIVPIGTRDQNGFVTRKSRNAKTGVSQ